MTSTHRLRSGKVYIVEIPVTETHSHGSGDVSSLRTVILELTTDTGLTGWGEASPWPVFTGTWQGNASALTDYFIPAVIGRDPFDVEVLMAEAEKMVVHCSEAKAAMETAKFSFMT